MLGLFQELAAVYVADLMGIMLAIVILHENEWRFREKSAESKALIVLVYVLLISNFAEALSFTVDKKPGAICYFISMLSNTWCFLSGVLVGVLGLIVITRHINMRLSPVHHTIVAMLALIGVLALIINLFIPVVFEIDASNTYSRRGGYILYIIIMYVFLTDAIICYFICKHRGSVERFFPVLEFSLPMIIGLLIQTFLFGVSTIWPCLTISMCGVFFSLQNENVFMDKLTNVYNRLFLDNINKQRVKFRNKAVVAIMVDMNRFKEINDKYGHKEGDAALCAVAQILNNIVDEDGVVIRYAGDEFVIFLNKSDLSGIESYKERIDNALAEYNRYSGKGYELSLSLGYGVFHLDKDSVSDIINEIDARMYEDKKAYYSLQKNNRRTD